MASQGPLYPGTAVDDNSVGAIAWTNPDNSKLDDGVCVTVPSMFGVITDYLKVTNFGFTIPVGATIDGIVIEVKKDGDSPFPGDLIVDNAVRIVKGGVIGSTELKSVSNWTIGTLTYTTYGDPTNLLGETWAYSDINSSTFGFVISANIAKPIAPLITAQIDAVRITVYYTAGTPTSTTTGLLRFC